MLSFWQLLGEEPVRCFCEVSSKHLKISDEKDPEKIMYKLPLVDLAFRLCEVIGSSMIPMEIRTLADCFLCFADVLCVRVVLEIGEQQTITDMLSKINCK